MYVLEAVNELDFRLWTKFDFRLVDHENLSFSKIG